jgi:hypothetical protein
MAPTSAAPTPSGARAAAPLFDAPEPDAPGAEPVDEPAEPEPLPEPPPVVPGGWAAPAEPDPTVVAARAMYASVIGMFRHCAIGMMSNFGFVRESASGKM